MALLKACLKSRLVNLVLDAANLRLETHNTLFVYGCHGEQVASTKMSSPANSRKHRKQNFNPSEIAVLTEKVEENLTILQSKLTNSVTNQKKNEIWQKIRRCRKRSGSYGEDNHRSSRKMEKPTFTSQERIHRAC